MFKFANPRRFEILSMTLMRWSLPLMFIFFVIGYIQVWGLPGDYEQGKFFKIMYVHVPTAWLSMGLYGGMALSSFSYLIWRHMMAFFVAKACAQVGLFFTLLCLLSGMFWGSVTWGTWWVWDARLTSVLLMAFLYAGVLIIEGAFEGFERRAHSSSVLAILGAINLPIIKWSVSWWNTLHQGASVTKFSRPSLAGEYLEPLLFCALGWGFLSLYATLRLTVNHKKSHH